ncbi:MAG: DUF188 domain-containing protein [Spirochaetaceae bacterium]|nr:DUF188 domain-containing protein [Spirochaetaceae bacterium]
MKIFVDADSCPVPARKVIRKAASRTGISAVFVANRPIPDLGDNTFMELCPEHEGAADDKIVEMAKQEDLVITRDVGLAKRLVEKSIAVMDDRGRLFTQENIAELYSIRCFQVGLAENNANIVRTAHYGQQELKSFSDSFDKILTSLLKK